MVLIYHTGMRAWCTYTTRVYESLVHLPTPGCMRAWCTYQHPGYEGRRRIYHSGYEGRRRIYHPGMGEMQAIHTRVWERCRLYTPGYIAGCTPPGYTSQYTPVGRYTPVTPVGRYTPVTPVGMVHLSHTPVGMVHLSHTRGLWGIWP